jgi:dCMP deaminase
MKEKFIEPFMKTAESGADTSWSDDTDTITLQDILELTKHIKQINLPITDKLTNKLLHWDGNPEEMERINQVTVSKQFPILVILDEQGQIYSILDGNHRLHKAIQSRAETIPAKLIKPSDLSDKAKKILYIRKQGVAEGAVLFVTHAPCIECAKSIYACGITSVYYRNPYEASLGSGLDFLERVGVKTILVEKKLDICGES